MWAALNLYECDLSDETKDPYYLLVEFPYPSGDLHIGHWYAFAVTDIYARMLRARGKNVLFPIGFDAFGLPAENAAIRNGVDPAKWTMANIERMREQLQSMGPSFDWSKEVVACDPSYYHWTQWLFSKLFEHGLAERREAPVKWCPKDQTVLANEQVLDGHCERCGSEVEEKVLTQWFLKITQYADRLLKNLETLPWREEIKEAQRAWIGRSEGAYLSFECRTSDVLHSVEPIKVFTTRPDTIFGATYLVLAPEHPLINNGSLTSIKNAEEVEAYVEATKKKTERERSENKEKTGVKLEGLVGINPATNEEIPIYVADYVLGSYGTGAVMAVPSHDDRDFEFAARMHLPVRQVVEPVLVQTTGTATFRHDESVQDSRGIIAIVKHWEDDTYMALYWPDAKWGTLLTGGVDEGTTPEETVLKEIREETGYTSAKIVRDLGVIHSKYYHAPKQLNRFGHAATFYLELADDAREEITPEERAKHELRWLTLEELRGFLTATSHQAALDLFAGKAYTGPGMLTNSDVFNGRDNQEAMWDVVAAAGGERTTQYRLRDWLVSRQRYWGCPIPIVYDPEGKPHAVPAEHLPWLLPTDVDFTPTGKAPLASSNELKERVTRLFGEGWTPEYDTLDTFVDSSWYFTRYLAPTDAQAFSNTALMKKWLPVNRYSGGSEHTTMHLLYARFFTMALYDLSLAPVEEPFGERFNRGIILGPDGHKMSKSKGNVINPDEFVKKYGADAVRLYLAFIGPYNEPGSYPWQLEGVASMRRFLDRVARLVEKCAGQTCAEDSQVRPAQNIERALAVAGKKVAEDGDRFKFNTGIAALMSLMNELEKQDAVPQWILRDVLVMLAPFAPHLAEHLWTSLGGEGSVHQAAWPAYDDALLVSEQATIVVQVSGKRRGVVTLAPGTPEALVLAAAHALPAVAGALPGEPSRVIYVPDRIINLIP